MDRTTTFLALFMVDRTLGHMQEKPLCGRWSQRRDVDENMRYRNLHLILE